MNLSPLEDASNRRFVLGGKVFTENDLDDVFGSVVVQTMPHMYFANTLLDDDADFIFCLEGAGLMGENFQKFFASNQVTSARYDFFSRNFWRLVSVFDAINIFPARGSLVFAQSARLQIYEA